MMHENTIEPVANKYLEEHSKCILKSFDDKFSVIFKGIPPKKSILSMNDLLALSNISSDSFKSHYVALIKENGEENVVGALSLITLKHQKQLKKVQRGEWQALRKHLSFLRSKKVSLLLWALSSNELDLDELYIDSLCVFESYRGMNIGSQLLDFTETQAKIYKLKKNSLHVSCKNDGARKLYERHGFQVKGVKNSWFSKRNLLIPMFFYMIKDISI